MFISTRTTSSYVYWLDYLFSYSHDHEHIWIFLQIGRGTAGWEDSLRQKPKKTEIFQVNPAPQKLQSKDAQKSASGNTELKERNKKNKRGRPRLHEKPSGDHEIDPTLEIRTDHKSSDVSFFASSLSTKLCYLIY